MPDLLSEIKALMDINEALEQMAAEIAQLKQERDFWRNEYEEVLSCIGGQDPRR